MNKTMDERIQNAYQKYFRDEITYSGLVAEINYIYQHHTGKPLWNGDTK